MITGDGTTARNVRDEIASTLSHFPWLWICDDIPMFPEGTPDHDSLWQIINDRIGDSDSRNVVISSQVKVGTCYRLEALHPDRRFAVIPENFQVFRGGKFSGNACDHICRTVIGSRSQPLKQILDLCLPKTIPKLWMSPESAEMVKHALNGFLAVSVQYANEIAALAQREGAHPEDVARGLMTDPRIGDRAYLRPGGGPGPHLTREVHNLQALGGGTLINALETPCESQ